MQVAAIKSSYRADLLSLFYRREALVVRNEFVDGPGEQVIIRIRLAPRVLNMELVWPIKVVFVSAPTAYVDSPGDNAVSRCENRLSASAAAVIRLEILLLTLRPQDQNRSRTRIDRNG